MTEKQFMSSKPKILVFDLDGTLVDSARDLIPALNKTTALDGIAPISIEEAGYFVGQGALKMIERAFQLSNKPLDQTRKRELLDIFLDIYEQNTAENTIFYDGAIDSLAVLKRSGWQFAVCTNKYEHLARKMLQELGQSHWFSTIAGGDTFAVKKPHGDHIVETVRSAGGCPDSAIMVGDSINDTSAAQAAGIPVIAVDFGYSDISVEKLKADLVISHFSKLPEAISEIEARR